MTVLTYVISDPPFGTSKAGEGMRSALGQTMENDMKVMFVGDGVEIARALSNGDDDVVAEIGAQSIRDHFDTLGDMAEVVFEEEAVEERGIEPPESATVADSDSIDEIFRESDAVIKF